MPNITFVHEHAILKAIIDGAEPIPVRLTYARPLTDRRQISVIHIDIKEEVAWIESLDDLNEPSRKIAEAELYLRYPICIITRITNAEVNHGQRLVTVETDRGPRYFNLREPSKNITMVSGNHVIIRDSMGNRFEIESLSRLDNASQRFFELIT